MPTFTAKIQDLKSGVVRIVEKEAHHIVDVLRMKKGDTVRLTDGCGGLFEGEIEEAGHGVTIAVKKNLPSPSPYPVFLFVSLLKSEKMEWIAEKAVELNIEGIHFIRTGRSVRTGISPQKLERIRRIAAQAHKQCGRSRMIKIADGGCWEEALQQADSNMSHFIFLKKGGYKKLTEIFREKSFTPPYGLWIGPEGGWEENEIADAIGRGFCGANLGPLVMRAETAAIHAISTLLATAF